MPREPTVRPAATHRPDQVGAVVPAGRAGTGRHVRGGGMDVLDRTPVAAPAGERPAEPRPGGPGSGGSGPGGSGGWHGWDDDASFPSSPQIRRWRRISSVLLATVLVLLVFAAGLGIGYAAYRPAPASSGGPSPPTNSPGAAAVAARVDPGLVDVDGTLTYDTVRSEGTGMVLTPSGEVVTNDHVIEGATSVHVTDIGTGRTYPATVVGYDIAADVAVLRLDGASRLPTVAMAAGPSMVGQPVVAVGNAGGVGGTPSAVTGTVTGLDQSITAGSDLSGQVEHLHRMIATSAPIQSGDSGGPLVDRAGRVLGMDTAGTSGPSGSGQGYAIPDAAFTAVVAVVRAGAGSSTVHVGGTAFLGVRVTTGTGGGAEVVRAEAGTPAANLGLATGDVLVSVGGHAVTTTTALTAILQDFRPGDTVAVSWKDATGALHAGTVTLATGPPA